MSRAAWLWRGASFVVAAGFIYLWQLVADAHLVSPVFLPGPDRAWAALVRGFSTGVLGSTFLGTVQRVVYGWLLASLVGIAVGATISLVAPVRRALEPTLEFLRPLPASAIIPVAIALFGLSNGMVIGVIAFGALWPMLLATVHGFSAVDPRLNEVSRALGMSRVAMARKIALPNSMPDILAGMRLSLTTALILSVVGEILSGQSGLGTWILLAARSFRAPDLFAGVMLLGLLGYVSSQGISVLEHHILRWRAATR